MKQYIAKSVDVLGITIDRLLLPNSKDNKPKIDEWKKCTQESTNLPIKINRVHTFQYDTFSDPSTYKTLPYIVDHLNEMKVRDQQRISKYMHSLNKVCKELKAIEETIPFFNSSIQSTFDIEFYRDRVKEYFLEKLFRMETVISTNANLYNDASVREINQFFDYMRNYTITKIRKLV